MTKLRKDEAKAPDHPLFSGSQPVGMVSGENPHWPAQASGHDEMGKTIAGMGLQAHPIEGRYGQPEKSWMVYGPSREQMYALGKQFGQDSVVYSNQGQHELMYTNGPNAGKHHSGAGHELFDQAPEDYYTKMPESDKYVRLSFDFDKLHPSKLDQTQAIDALNSRVTKSEIVEGLLAVLRKAIAPKVMPHPNAYAWHEGHTKHHMMSAAPGAVLVSGSLKKSHDPAPQYREVHPHEFEAAISKHPNQGSLSQNRDYTGKKAFLAHDGQSGYVLHGGDLQSVFSLKPGHGSHAVRHAIANGATTLDAFEGKLPEYYSKFGFKEHRREKNWTPGGPDVVYMSLSKSLDGDKDLDFGAASTHVPFGSIDKSAPADLLHYPYHGKEEAVNKLLKDHGYTAYVAGGRHGRPDLANRNYDTKHLMIADPESGSGGDQRHEEYTANWRKLHELSHALTQPELDKLYGEGKRSGQLGKDRTIREAMRAVHGEALAADKQRELSKSIGIDIPDNVFNKEKNTILHDAVQRVLTGTFKEPSGEGFRPHEHEVPLEHALKIVREAGSNLGLTGMHDTLKKFEENSMSESDDKIYSPGEWRQELAKSIQARVDAYSQELLALRQKELKKALPAEPAPAMSPMDACPLCGQEDAPGKCTCLGGAAHGAPAVEVHVAKSLGSGAYPGEASGAPAKAVNMTKNAILGYGQTPATAGAVPPAAGGMAGTPGLPMMAKDEKSGYKCKSCGKDHGKDMEKCDTDHIKSGAGLLEKDGLSDSIAKLKSATKVTSAMNDMRSKNPGMPKPAAPAAPKAAAPAAPKMGKDEKKYGPAIINEKRYQSEFKDKAEEPVKAQEGSGGKISKLGKAALPALRGTGRADTWEGEGAGKPAAPAPTPVGQAPAAPAKPKFTMEDYKAAKAKLAPKLPGLGKAAMAPSAPKAAPAIKAPKAPAAPKMAAPTAAPKAAPAPAAAKPPAAPAMKKSEADFGNCVLCGKAEHPGNC